LIGGPIFTGADHSGPFPLRLWASVIKGAENIQKTVAARAMIVRIAISSERISRTIPDFDPKCIETRLRFFSEISRAQQIRHFLGAQEHRQSITNHLQLVRYMIHCCSARSRAEVISRLTEENDIFVSNSSRFAQNAMFAPPARRPVHRARWRRNGIFAKSERTD